MIVLNVEKLLKEQGKTKSWLCNEMDITFYNLNKALKVGKKSISYKYLEGFSAPDAILTAAETRSSSPVRILRDKDSLQSVSINGLYPCGEGAGYAGGIISAAVDGIKCAEKILIKY